MANNLTNLGHKVSSRELNWADLCQRAWGAEFNAPDHGVYEFGSRKFDSTDKNATGIYNSNALSGLLLEQAALRYPDMTAFLLTEAGAQLDLG